MTIPRNVFGELAAVVSERRAQSATKYISPKLVVKATVRSRARRGLHTELVFTIGRPNWSERRFITACRNSGERFPVRKVQIKWPKKRRAQ